MNTLLALKFLGAVVAVIAAAYSLYSHSASERQKRVILFCWMLLPPIFFYFEYYFQAPTLSAAELQRFKDLQDLASKIWAAFVAALAVAFLKTRD